MKKIPCEIYSRIVGYFRPVQSWNKGKQEEFRNRVPYIIKEEDNDIEGRHETSS